MFCTKCGNQLADGAAVCDKCGAAVEGAKVEETKVEETVVETPVEEAPAEEKKEEVVNDSYVVKEEAPAKKSSKGGLIAAIVAIAVVVLAICGVLFWMNRPINKINKAVEKNDMETVAQLYPKLTKEAEIESVEDKLIEKCEELADSYLNEEAEYDVVSSELKALDDVLAGNKKYDKAVEKVEAMKASRDAYEKAEKAFEKEDYEKALDNYLLVIEDDSNYDDAQDKIEECKANLIPDVVGQWVCSIDVAKAAMEAAEIGDYYNSSFYLPIDIVIDFDEYGSAVLSVDTESLRAEFDGFMGKMIDLYIEVYADELGMSLEELDSYTESFYGMTFKEYALESIDVEDMIGDLAYVTDYYDYEIQDDKVVLSSFSDEMNLTFDAGNLVMSEADNTSLGELSEAGVEMPLVFIKK